MTYFFKLNAEIGVLAGKRSLIKKRRARIATIIMLVYFIPSDKSIKYNSMYGFVELYLMDLSLGMKYTNMIIVAILALRFLN